MSLGTEEEQLAQIRDWWRRNGKPLVAGSVLALLAVFGWQAWQKQRVAQAQSASVLYQELLSKVLDGGQPDAAAVARLGNALKKEHAGTPYAQYGSLFMAKVAVESGQLDEAASELRLIVERPVDATLGELARQRLASVLAAQGKPERGLDLLQGEVAPAFVASHEELKGDLLVLLGRKKEAHDAYLKARNAMSRDAAAGALQLKLDDLAQGDSTDA